MTVKIKMKDTTTPIFFKEVLSHFLEGVTLAILFKDGTVRNIPLVHILYYETKQPREKIVTPSEVKQQQ